MYSSFLFFHSIFRWLVLLSLLYAIYRAAIGLARNKAYSKADDSIRHRTATVAHIQLIIGFVVYILSPVVKYYFSAEKPAGKEPFFFGILHIGLMLVSIVVITIGSSLAKRKPTDRLKFKTQLLWFSIGLIIIIIAIPWPFSPLAARPYYRPF